MKLLLLFLFATFSYGNKADVISAKVRCDTKRICTFTVTIKHQDKGWKHYSNKFEVLTLNKKSLATRILHHPHVQEQPFTRSISGVKIPKGVNRVIIRANDSVHGFGGKEVVLKL